MHEQMKIISEIGINHNGDFRKIEELIRQSAIGGADYARERRTNLHCHKFDKSKICVMFMA